MKKLYIPTLLTFFFLSFFATVQGGGTFIVKNAYEDIVLRQGGLQARSMHDQVGTTMKYDGVTTVNYFPKRLGKPIVLFKIEDYFHLDQSGIQEVTTTINNEDLVITFYVEITRSDDETKCILPKDKIQKVYVEILSVTLNGLAFKQNEHVTMPDHEYESWLEDLKKKGLEWEAQKNENLRDKINKGVKRGVKKVKSDKSGLL